MIRKSIFILFIGIISYTSTYAQCPTSGTISANCTSSSLTISGSTLNVDPGVIVTVTGTLTVKNGGIINGTGATFNVGGLAETNASTNTFNGGTYNTGSFSTGNGGDFAMDGVTVNISPSGSVSIAGTNVTIDNSTFTGVTNWSVNVSSFSMTDTDITASGSIQFEDATISGGTFTAGTSFSTTNGTNTISGSTISAGTTATVKNTTFTNSSLDAAGLLTIQSGSVSFDNSTINSGTGNVGTNDAQALTMNGGGVLTLTGNSQMNVRGWLTNNELYIDGSDVVVTGDFDNAGSEILEVSNDGSISVGGDFNNSGSGSVSADDGGIVQVDGDYDNSGGGSTDVNGGGIVVGGTFSGNTPTGDADTNCTGGSGGCCGDACATLPVQLVSFKVVQDENIINIKWSTVSEQDNSHFTLEKSLDGESFVDFAIVEGAGSSNEKNDYKVVDLLSSTQSIYYRLSQTDFDGTKEFLGVAAASSHETTLALKVYPNPVTKGEHIQISGSLTSLTNWKVYGLNGKVIGCGVLNQYPWIETSSWDKGLYFLQLATENSSQTFRIFVE
jgi:hypothetical protein